MAINRDFTLRRHNGTDLDVLYPTTRWAQINEKPATFTPTSHTHGNITNGGAIGSTPNLMVKTGASGLLTTLTAGTTSQFLRGDGIWATPQGLIETRANVNTKIWTGTQTQYDAIVTKDATTLYFITE